MSRSDSPEINRQAAAILHHVSVATTNFARKMRWMGFSDAQIRHEITKVADSDGGADLASEDHERLRMAALVAMERVLREPKQAPPHERN
jgi:hypothetical protein